jgi:hypothetical protein
MPALSAATAGSASLALRSQDNAAPTERTRLPSRASALLCVLSVSSEKGCGVLRIQLREAAGAADPRLETRLHLAFEEPGVRILGHNGPQIAPIPVSANNRDVRDHIR